MILKVNDWIMPLTPVRNGSDRQSIDSKAKSEITVQMLGKRKPGRPPHKEETIAKHRKRHEQEARLAQYNDHLNDKRFT